MTSPSWREKVNVEFMVAAPYENDQNYANK
jgi:hypothetical protein